MTSGYRSARSRAAAQCVVARRPPRSPASARSRAPVQIEAAHAGPEEPLGVAARVRPSGAAPPKRRSRSPASWRSSCIACGATARASAGRRRRSADDELNNEIRRRRMVSLPGRCDGHPAGSVGACQISADSACNIGEAVAPNAIMGWTVFQPRREQWTRQRYQLAPPESLRSRPQLENSALKHAFIEA